MKKDILLKKLNITGSQLDDIKAAVAQAEKETTGEIALAVTYQSDSYSFVELFGAVCVAFVSFAVLLFFSNDLWQFLEKTVWYPQPAQLIGITGVAVAVVTAVFFFLLNIPVLDRLVIPKSVKASRVYARALRHFVECGIYKTAERTGILIFISVLERSVFVIADCGIAEKVAQAEWDEVCSIMTRGIRAGNTAQAFCDAVRVCGAVLSRSFPKNDCNPNEYPDGLTVLEV